MFSSGHCQPCCIFMLKSVLTKGLLVCLIPLWPVIWSFKQWITKELKNSCNWDTADEWFPPMGPAWLTESFAPDSNSLTSGHTDPHFTFCHHNVVSRWMIISQCRLLKEVGASVKIPITQLLRRCKSNGDKMAFCNDTHLNDAQLKETGLLFYITSRVCQDPCN